MVLADTTEIPKVDWDRLEEKIAAFDASWNRGEPPRIGDFLDHNEPHHLVLLIELVHTDFEYRLKRGESARVEDYLATYPGLADSRTTVLELIRAEWSFRKRRERELSYARFIERFPGFQDELEPDETDVLDSPTRSLSVPSALTENPLLLPRKFGRYELLQKIGLGPVSVVYRAFDTCFGREVAIKIPRPEVIAEHPDVPEMFSEAAKAQGLSHPHIVALREIDTIEGTDCLVNAYVEATSLAEQIRLAPFAPEEAAALMILVAEALDHAHRQRIIHRNLKPTNILIDNEGQPHLADFGLCQTAPGRSSLSIGALPYLSPEQSRGEVEWVDARSDVFSLGVILYELLTGSVPFRGRGRILLQQIQRNEPTPPASLNEEVVPDLQRVCLKAVAKSPEARYSSAREFADDLRTYLSGRKVPARPVRRRRLLRVTRAFHRHSVIVALGLFVVAIASTIFWWNAEQARVRNASLLDQSYRVLLELARPAERPGVEGLLTPEALTDQIWFVAEKLAPQIPNDPAFLALSFEVRSRLAVWARSRGSDRRAEIHWSEVIALIDRLRLVQPDSLQLQERLADAQFNLAAIRQRSGRKTESRTLYEQSLALRRRILEAQRRIREGEPQAPSLAIDRVEALIRIAETERAMGQRPDVSEIESIVSDPSFRSLIVPADRFRLANAALDLASLELQDKMEFKSLRIATEALRLCEPVASGPLARIGSVRALLAQARASRAAEHLIESKTQLQQAIAGFESLIRDGFDTIELRRDLGEALFVLGRILGETGPPTEAIAAYERSLAIRRGLANGEPGGYLNWLELAETRQALALELGQPPRRSAQLILLTILDRARVFGLAPGLKENRRELRRLVLLPFQRPRILGVQDEAESSIDRGGAASTR